MLRRTVKVGAIVAVVLFVAVQFVPYGRDHDNPPVTNEIAWDSPRTEELTRAACFDCHSNETEWPWYSNVAPMSWLVQMDVEEGRDKLNYSVPDGMDDAGESAEVVAEGEMPPRNYTLLHADARLSDAEREALVEGLIATFGDEGDERDDDDD
ncbi:MAG TPA: heme-binding domain-containing protein [Actinomycetota bacterium]|nr:heme-binding domain-containing protein [Actinomycetota bacterium]